MSWYTDAPKFPYNKLEATPHILDETILTAILSIFDAAK
jgi:hypothetical protein